LDSFNPLLSSSPTLGQTTPKERGNALGMFARSVPLVTGKVQDKRRICAPHLVKVKQGDDGGGHPSLHRRDLVILATS
jgi:hypothetical protein